MNEPEPEAEQPGSWAPPTGAPAPRPDPYAQFGNPLHDTWGTSGADATKEARVVGTPKAWRRRSRLRWAVTAGIVAVVAVGGWFARDTVVDTWNRVYDKAAEVTGGAGSDTEATATTAKSIDERLAEMEAPKDKAFADWMKANREELSRAVDRMYSLNDEMVVLNQELNAGGTPDLGGHLGTMTESHDATLATARMLDTAPESAIRNDFMTVLLLQTAESGRMIEAADAEDAAGVRSASQRFGTVSAEITRLCRQYGDRAGELCR